MKYLRWNVRLLKVLLKLGSHDRKLALIRLPTYLYMRGVHLRWALFIQLSYPKKQGMMTRRRAEKSANKFLTFLSMRVAAVAGRSLFSFPLRVGTEIPAEQPISVRTVLTVF